MVGDTGSTQINKDEVDSHSSKNKKKDIRTYPSTYNSEKAGVSGVGRSAKETSVRLTTPSPQSILKSKNISLPRQAMPSPQSMGFSNEMSLSGQTTPHPSSMQNCKETSSSEQTMPSSQSMCKSKHLEIGMCSSPLVNRISERKQKHEVATPMKRLDRGKNNLSNPSSSKKSKKNFRALGFQRKKKRALIQVTMESEKAELDLEPVSMKRKKMSGRTFKGLFKVQRTQEPVPDEHVELEGPGKSSRTCNGSSRGIGSKPVKNGKGSTDKASDGALWKSTFSKKDWNVDVDDNTHSHIKPCPIASVTSLGVGETFDFSGRLSSNENIDGPESGSSTCLARSRDGSVCSENCEEWSYLEGPPPSPSPKCDNRNLIGTCVLCSKNRRVGYDSPKQDLCTCSPTGNDDLCGFSVKGRNGHGADITLESTQEFLSREVNGDSQTVGQGNVCSFCYMEGDLLCCAGRDCNRRYHLCCLDPSLTDALPGVWHCSQCVKRKLLFGVHSVSKGVEAIWDVREVDITGVQQKQYLVKYHGLAHIHNHWVPDKQLLLENPGLVAKFIEDNKNVRWCADWTVPHRLLRRKTIQDNVYIASSTVISVCNHEWLVKWCGLSYDDATWELECTHFLSTSLGQKLMNDYETRRLKVHQEVNKHQKESIGKLLKLPAVLSHVNDNMLKNVNKLRDCLSRCQNAVVFDDQEQVTAIILLIQSVSEICWPFLIVTASSSLSQWEAEFAELMPSVDVVVYSGNRNTRKATRSSEFDDEGRMILQILLTSTEALLEDLDILKSIKWEAIVIDELQHPLASNDLEQIKMLNTDSRILLSSGQTKDTASEYLRILSLLESQSDLDKLRGLKAETNDNVCKLRDRLSCFIPYRSTSQGSKLLEYWVPVEISNHQLEQYCYTLLDKKVQLCSCSPKDSVGAVREVVDAVRKCCDHPYLLDTSLQERLIEALCPASELLNIGIKASGKLQLLDMMLTEIKARGLRVLILFQKLLMQSKGVSTGDILDDFLRQRFGQNTYERVDNGLLPSKKQSSVNRFNLKETGQFAFLLENRACTSVIKLSSLDAVIIFDSDWNPANDLRALQRITIDSKVGQVKVFRLYSCSTVEEKALVLAKQNLNLDSHLQNFNRTTSDSLLSWGAVDLFRKLEKFHANRNSTPELTSSGQLLLNEVTNDFQVLLSWSGDDTGLNTVISKAKLSVQARVQSYTLDIPMFGESKAQMIVDGEEPYVFWRNLFYGKNPQWKLISNPNPRIRKRVQYSEKSISDAEAEKVDVVKKRKKMVNGLHSTSVQTVQEVNKEPQVVANEGISASKPCNKPQSLQKDLTTFNNDQNCTSGQRSSTERERHHSFLQVQLTRLCEILQLTEDVTQAARRFLEYVIKNHHVNTDSPSIMHAFQISLCWITASIRKQKVDKKESLMLAKRLRNYQCTEEQVHSVYSKMRDLKKMYLQSPEYAIDSYLHSLAADDTNREPINVSQGTPHFLSHVPKHSMKIGESSGNEDYYALLQKKLTLTDSAADSEIDNALRKILETCDKRMKKCKQRHQKALEKFHRTWDEEKEKLENDCELESRVIRYTYQGSLQLSNELMRLNATFAKKMEELNIKKNAELKDLEARQLAAVNEERQKADQWLAEAQACPSELRAVSGSKSLGSLSEDGAGGRQPSTGLNVTSPGEECSMGQHKDQDQSKSSHTVESDDVPPVITKSATAEATSSETPGENISVVDLQKKVEAMLSSLEKTEHLDQSKHSCDNGETVSGSPYALGEKDSVESQPVHEELLTEHVHPPELDNPSKNVASGGSGIASPDILVSLGDEHDEDDGGDLQNTEKILEHLEEAATVPDCSESLPEQVQLDTTGQSLAYADGPALQNKNTSHVEVTIEEQIDTAISTQSNHEATVNDVTILPSNDEVPITENTAELCFPSADAVLSSNESPIIEDSDCGGRFSPPAEPCRTQTIDTAISTQSNHEAAVNDVTTLPSNDEVPVTENTAELCVPSADAVLSSNEFPITEDRDCGGRSSPPAEPCRSQTVSHESTSGDGETLKIPGIIDTGPMTDVGHGQSIELSKVPQDNAATPSVGVSSPEQTNQAEQPVGMNAGHGPGYLAHPTHQPYHSNQTQPLLEDPLQNELERMREETEQLEKNHENFASQLKLECEKEIEVMVAQISLKYDLKLQETADEYRLKRNALDRNRNLILMNKMLADAHKAKCLDHKTSGLPGVQQGVGLSVRRGTSQVQPPHSVRPFLVAPSSQPAAPPQQITPPVRTMQPRPQPHPVRLSSDPSQRAATAHAHPMQYVSAPSQSAATPPTRPMQHVSAPIQSASATRPAPPTRPMQHVSAPRQSATPPAPPVQHISVPSQGAATPPVQPTQRTPIISGTPPRPLVISSFSPSVNPHVSGEIRARAPHLQSQSRPRPPVPAYNTTSPPASQLQHQQMPRSHQVQPPLVPPVPRAPTPSAVPPPPVAPLVPPVPRASPPPAAPSPPPAAAQPPVQRNAVVSQDGLTATLTLDSEEQVLGQATDRVVCLSDDD